MSYPKSEFWMNKLLTTLFHQFLITNSHFFFSITWHDPTCPGYRSSRQWEPWWNSFWNSTLCKKCHFAAVAKTYTQSNSYHQNDEKIVKKHQCARWPFRSNSFYAGSHVLQCAQVQVQVNRKLKKRNIWMKVPIRQPKVTILLAGFTRDESFFPGWLYVTLAKTEIIYPKNVRA